MDPLEALLRPVAKYLNRTIAEITPARELCARLDGKVVAIRVRDTALARYFVFDAETVELAVDSEREPDVAITASIVTLASMIGSDGAQAIRDGKVDLTGNAGAAEAFRDLLAYTKPDIEEELSKYVGDAAAHRLGQLAAGLRNWALEARSTMSGNIREYLQEESRDVPSRYEVDEFARKVDALRDDVERLATRLNRLESGK